MFYKVDSETTYEKMGAEEIRKEGVERERERERERESEREREREREREIVAFLVYALSSINGLRFIHFVSNWASLFFIK